jgi:hypothetical protein
MSDVPIILVRIDIDRMIGCRWLIALSFVLNSVLAFAQSTTVPASDSGAATRLDMPADLAFGLGRLLYSDDFSHESGQWVSELESGGKVVATGDKLDVDVPAGATIWFKTVLRGPVLIQYSATAVGAGGPNDRVSDLNCFWMARDSRDPWDLFAVKRSGKFVDYNRLLTYYVGLGGNGNTTTRFRRYIGDPVVRPMRAQDDLKGKENLLTANRKQTITLIAAGNIVRYYRDGKCLFDYWDPQPYASGWFGFRTTKSHFWFSGFGVWGLVERGGAR